MRPHLFPHLANVCPHCGKRWPMIAEYHLRWMAAGELAKHLIAEHGWEDVSTRYPGEPIRWFYALGTCRSGNQVRVGNLSDCGPYRLPLPSEFEADDLYV